MPFRILTVLLTASLVAAVILAIWLWRSRDAGPTFDRADLPEFCRVARFEANDHVVCEIDPRHAALGIYHSDRTGAAYGSLDAFDAAMTASGRPVRLAMNAGMYHEGLGPVGLLVSGGRQMAPLNIADGEGNFFLKPNGVFGIDADGAAFVEESSAFAASGRRPREATQSGPMLVIDGRLHPRFEPNGTSRYVRNGVGVRADGVVVLALSLGKVSLGSFARLFRDELGCPNALFFDGEISTLSNGSKTLVGGRYPVGPILAVTEAPSGG